MVTPDGAVGLPLFSPDALAAQVLDSVSMNQFSQEEKQVEPEMMLGNIGDVVKGGAGDGELQFVKGVCVCVCVCVCACACVCVCVCVCVLYNVSTCTINFHFFFLFFFPFLQCIHLLCQLCARQ